LSPRAPALSLTVPIESIYAPVEVESCAVSDDGDDAAADDASHSLFGADDVSPFSGGDDDDADATSKTLRSASTQPRVALVGRATVTHSSRWRRGVGSPTRDARRAHSTSIDTQYETDVVSVPFYYD